MAVREIKTTLSLDGEKEFNRAISEAGRGMRVMASEMKAAAADFDVTGDEMEYLGRKSKSLNGQIEQQEKIIRALEGAVADSAQTYGEASAKTDGYRIKLNNAYAALSRLKKEHEQTDKRMEELGRDSERTGRRLEQGIGEAADDVSRKFDGMINKLDSDLGSIKAMTSISAVVDVAGTIGGAVKGAYDAVTGLVEETAEYNKTMAFLKTNADQAGISFQTVKKMAVDVSGITGDMDATIEGLSNLLASGFEADELSIAVERLSGAIIQIPDTLKFESLADGLQETIATRNAVGQYAEYLERMGLDLDTVNKALANAGKEGQEAVESVALSFLSGHGAEEALEKYRAENEALVKYFEAQAKLTDAQARLGETMTPAATAGIEAMSVFVDKLNEMVVSVIGTVEKLNTEDPVQNKLIEWADKLSGVDTKETYSQTGKNMVSEIVDGAESEEQNAETDMKTIGDNIGTYVNDGLKAQIDTVASTAAAMYQAIEAELNKPITGPKVIMPGQGSATSYGGQGSLTVNVNSYIDGKKLSKSTVETDSAAIGNAIDRAITYGP